MTGSKENDLGVMIVRGADVDAGMQQVGPGIDRSGADSAEEGTCGRLH